MMNTGVMMLKTGLMTLMLAIMLTLSGCIISVNDDEAEWGIVGWEDKQKDNRKVIARLNIGDSRVEVLSQLGEPAFTEGFTSAGQDYQVYYFRTHRRHSDGRTSKNETTPVVFADNHLIGWGQKALDQAMMAGD